MLGEKSRFFAEEPLTTIGLRGSEGGKAGGFVWGAGWPKGQRSGKGEQYLASVWVERVEWHERGLS